jgi:hypothetical protein
MLVLAVPSLGVIAFVLGVAACNGLAAPAVAPAVAAPPASSSTASVPAAVQAPGPVPAAGVWLHVEHPGRLAPLVRGADLRYETFFDDLGAWSTAIDPDAPLDAAGRCGLFFDFGSGVVRFRTRDGAAVRSVLSRRGNLVDIAPGIVGLDRSRTEEEFQCRIPPAGEAGSVLCAPADRLLGADAWLEGIVRSGARPVGDADLHIACGQDPKWSGDDKYDEYERSLQGLATLTAAEGGASLSLELHAAWKFSPWNAAKVGHVPASEAFGRFVRVGTDVLVSSGGDGGSLTETVNRPLMASLVPYEARDIFDKPWLAGDAIEMDEARGALARLGAAPAPPSPKLIDELREAFRPITVLALTIDVASVRSWIGPTRVSGLAVRPATPDLALPTGSFFVTAPGRNDGELLVMPDGEVTWALVGPGRKRVTRFATTLMHNRRAALPELAVGGAVLARGWHGVDMTSLDMTLMDLNKPYGPPATREQVQAAMQTLQRCLTPAASPVLVTIARDPSGDTTTLHMEASGDMPHALIHDAGWARQMQVRSVFDLANVPITINRLF